MAFEKVKVLAKRGVLTVLAVAFAVFSNGPAWSAEKAVDLELVLAVDVSDSIDRAEARLQRDGYIAALTDPAVVEAMRSGLHGRIALTYAEWAGRGHYKVVADWTVIDGPDSARAFAARLAAAPLETALRTSISDAIMLSVPRFSGNGYEGMRRIIDISGDGPNNFGGLVDKARDAAVAAGVTINGLPILPQPGEIETHGAIRELDLYYEDCVIGGPGAFIIIAEGYDTFAAAIRRKLIREIAGTAMPRFRIRRAAARDRPSCNIGEWLWFNSPLVPPKR